MVYVLGVPHHHLLLNYLKLWLKNKTTFMNYPQIVTSVCPTNETRDFYSGFYVYVLVTRHCSPVAKK